jgi:hypothetical protein
MRIEVRKVGGVAHSLAWLTRLSITLCQKAKPPICRESPTVHMLTWRRNHTKTYGKIETQNLLEETLQHMTRNVQKEQMIHIQNISKKIISSDPGMNTRHEAFVPFVDRTYSELGF